MLNPNFKKLDNSQKELCDLDITIEECSIAVQKLSNNKSPGTDGLPVDFYKFFWTKLKYFLVLSYKWSIENSRLSSVQKRGIKNLVPKKNKDLCSLNNWRPISVLNADYKILAKVFAIQLQKVLNTLINPDQVGYIKGRFIGENICTIKHIIDYCTFYNKPGLVILVDFAKAFDSLTWSFLFKCLKTMNFGHRFIDCIKMLYNDIQSCVINNGKSSQFFNLHRGISQGCCYFL